MDIFQVNTVMTDIPNDAVTAEHRAILRIMGYDLHEQNEPAGTVYISSDEPISDLATAIDIAEGDDDEDLISCSSLAIDAKAGQCVGICEVLQSILKEPAANGLECIDIQGAHFSQRPARGYFGGWAARIERDRIRVFDSMTAFDKPMTAENTKVPRVVVFSEGGLVLDVIANTEVHLMIVDHDVEGSHVTPIDIEGAASLLLPWCPGGEDADKNRDLARIDAVFNAAAAFHHEGA